MCELSIDKYFSWHLILFVLAGKIVLKPVSWLHTFEIILDSLVNICGADQSFRFPRIAEQKLNAKALKVLLDNFCGLLYVFVKSELKASHIFTR